MSYRSVAFVDEFWLAILLCQRLPLTPSGLIFLNTTQKTADDEELAQTTFYFDPSKHNRLMATDLVFDKGGYQPSREDDAFAPFYPDPLKRVLVVGFGSQASQTSHTNLLVMKIETLLGMSREQKGQYIQWEEWKSHAIPILRRYRTRTYWVSGPQLFCVSTTYSPGERESLMDVFDLSAPLSTRCTEMVGGGMAERFEPSITHVLPAWMGGPYTWYGCHDSIVFTLVKTLYSQTQMKLTD